MLSGGQQQRLAMARALVMEPPVLLLDEPLSNLDTRLREDLRVELTRIQEQLGVTSVYVTHDQGEALAMSSSLAVMRDGVIEQQGMPEELYDYPRTRFVASFLGAANLIEARVSSTDDGKADLFRFSAETAWGATFDAVGRMPFKPGDRVSAALRPEGVRVSRRGDTEGDDAWLGVIESVQFLGDAVVYFVRVRDILLRARAARGVHRFAAGDAVAVELRSEACTLVAD